MISTKQNALGIVYKFIFIYLSEPVKQGAAVLTTFVTTFAKNFTKTFAKTFAKTAQSQRRAAPCCAVLRRAAPCLTVIAPLTSHKTLIGSTV